MDRIAEFPRYRILRLLGSGSYSNVYLAHDLLGNEQVALKLFTNENTQAFDFSREVSFHHKITHPNFVSFRDAGICSNNKDRFIALEYVDGSDFISASLSVTRSQFYGMIVEILRALHYLERKGLSHGDLAPRNILVQAATRRSTHAPPIKLADFGFGHAIVRHGQHIPKGTPHYIAPEILRGDHHSIHADLYSLGAILYECLAGHPPFQGESIGDIIRGHLDTKVPIIESESLRELHPLIYQLLAKDPGRRPRTVREAWKLLSSLAAVPLAPLETPHTWDSLVSSLPAVGFSHLLTDVMTSVRSASSRGGTNLTIQIIQSPVGTGKSRFLRELQFACYLSGFHIVHIPDGFENIQHNKLLRIIESLPRELPSQPCVVLLDKIESESACNSLIEFAVTLRPARNLVFLFTLNTTLIRPDVSSGIIKQLDSLGHTVIHDIPRLTRGDIEIALKDGLGAKNVSSSVLDYLYSSSGGIPAFIVALLASSLQSGSVVLTKSSLTNDTPLNDAALPPGIRDLCRSILGSLTQAEERIVCELAASFAQFGECELATLMELSTPHLTSLVLSLEAKGVVSRVAGRDSDSITLASQSLDTYINELLPPDVRIAIHSRLAAWHLSRPPSLDFQELAALHLVAAGKVNEAAVLSAQVATAATRLDQHTRAVRFYKIALSDSPPNSVHRAELSLGLAHSELELGFLAASRSSLRPLLDDLELPCDLRARAYICASRVAFLSGDSKSQESSARQALRLSSRRGLLRLKVQAMLSLGSAWCWSGREPDGKRIILRGLRHARRIRASNLVAQALQDCAALARLQGHHPLAYRYARRRHRLLLALGDRTRAAYARGQIGLLLCEAGRYVQARTAYSLAVAEASSVESQVLSAQLSNNLAEIDRVCGFYPQALLSYKKALVEAETTGQQHVIVTARDNVAHILGRAGFYQDAHAQLKHIFRICGYTHEPQAICNALLGWSRFLLLVGQFSVAHTVSSHTCHAVARYGQSLLMLDAKTSMARALFRIGKISPAMLLLKDGLKVSEMHSSFESRMTARLLLSELSLNSQAPPESVIRELMAFVETSRRKIMRWHLSNALSLRGQALLLLDRAEAALPSLEESAAIARRTGDRPSFWRATFHRGRAFEQLLRYEQALACYRVAALTVQEIGRDLEEDRYRESFMAQAEVQEVLERYAHLKRQVGKKTRRNLAAMHRNEMISRKMLGALNTIGQKLTSVLDLNELLSLILDLSIENVRAERGIVFLRDEESGEMRADSARGMDRSDLEEASSFSRSVVQRAAEGQSLLAVDVNNDPTLSAYESLVIHEIKSILCVPMRSRGHVVGVIYLDTRRATQMFSEKERSFVESFASQAAVAIENARLFGHMNAENTRLRREVEGRSRFENLIGSSPAMRDLTQLMASVLDSDCNVLIVGESGTGKELVAKALHHNGPRRSKAFVAIDCGALPENLIEAELFGYARGAFTGADRDRLGLIEEACGGTLFLDEITNTSTSLQARLLRVLQEREIRRVGENTPRRVDVRIIAATNQNIRSLMEAGGFRQDLFYRLNVVTIEVPALRERREDIPLLVEHFLRERATNDRVARRIAPAALRLLEQHEWPGNVRELQNVIERVVVLSRGSVVGAGTIRRIINPDLSASARLSSAGEGVVRTGEQLMIEEALRRCLGDKAKAARYIGWTGAVLEKMRDRLGTEGFRWVHEGWREAA